MAAPIIRPSSMKGMGEAANGALQWLISQKLDIAFSCRHYAGTMPVSLLSFYATQFLS